ncbi:MAG: HD domain-containing protein [Bacteroidota bacterium]
MSDTPLPHEAVLRTVGAVADRLKIEAYAVGGAVRDAFLGRPTTDLDFVSIGNGSGITLAKAVGKKMGGRTVHVYENFGTAAIRLPESEGSLVLEFVGARKESYRAESRKPLVEDGTLEEDQARRDFTVNALALALGAERFGNVLDPFGGMIDLVGKKLRTPLDPHVTFEDDPLRMLRAARFAAQLGFDLDIDAERAMRDRAPRLAIVSAERIVDELNKILLSPKPSVGLEILYQARLLEHFLPELPALAGVETVGGQSHKDNFFHTLEVVDNLAAMTAERDDERVLWLRWAALLHDHAKPETKRFSKASGWTFHGHEDRGARNVPTLFRRLKLPLDERMIYVRDLVALHHRPVALVDDAVTDSAVRRLLFDAGDRIDDLMLLVRADITSKNPSRVRRYLAAFDRVEAKFAEVEEKDRLRHFEPPVDGHEIMETLGVREGVAVGIVKEWIREAILEGEIPNEHDPAFAFMMAKKDEALRRAALFDEVVPTLEGPERAATGAIKEAVFWSDVPAEHAEAVAYLRGIASAAQPDSASPA